MGRVATLQRNGVENRIHIPGDMWHHVRICCIGKGCCCGVYRELSAPSVVSAEATWYGSLRAGVSSQDSDTKFADGGSRWGIKGSSEISDGLTAVYRFEHKIDTAKASLTGGGRLAYAGLKGGFGTITAGQIWSASFNSFGAITDNSFAYGNSETTYRHGSVISYANSFGPASVQLDLVMDGAKDTGKDIDQVEFGLSVELGDIGKIAIAHIKKEDSVAGTAGSYTVDVLKNPVLLTTTTNTSTVITTASIEYIPKFWAQDTKSPKLTLGTATVLTVAQGVVATVKKSVGLTIKPVQDTVEGLRVIPTTATCSSLNSGDDECVTIKAYGSDELVYADAGTKKKFYFLDEDVNLKDGSTSNHIAAEFSFGGVIPHLGYSEKKMVKARGRSVKDKTTFFGVRGSLGDTGFGYVFQYRDKEEMKEGMMIEYEPWILGLSKTMGGGASLHFEHSGGMKDAKGKKVKSTTGVWLKVDF